MGLIKGLDFGFGGRECFAEVDVEGVGGGGGDHFGSIEVDAIGFRLTVLVHLVPGQFFPGVADTGFESNWTGKLEECLRGLISQSLFVFRLDDDCIMKGIECTLGPLEQSHGRDRETPQSSAARLIRRCPDESPGSLTF